MNRARRPDAVDCLLKLAIILSLLKFSILFLLCLIATMRETMYTQQKLIYTQQNKKLKRDIQFVPTSTVTGFYFPDPNTIVMSCDGVERGRMKISELFYVSHK